MLIELEVLIWQKSVQTLILILTLRSPLRSSFLILALDLTTAVTLFLKQSIREQAIPFEIKRNVANAETIAAMDEYYEMKAHPEKYKRYSSFRETIDEVLADA